MKTYKSVVEVPQEVELARHCNEEYNCSKNTGRMWNKEGKRGYHNHGRF